MITKKDYKQRAEENLKSFIDFDIKFPFCYKTQKGEDYFRYMEDGRFENIHISEHRKCMLFGTYTNHFTGIIEHNVFYFKIASQRHTLITNDEFEFARKLLMSYYDKYLNAELHVAHEVVEKIRLREIDIERDKRDVERERENDIITLDDIGDEYIEPF